MKPSLGHAVRCPNQSQKCRDDPSNGLKEVTYRQANKLYWYSPTPSKKIVYETL